MEPMRLPNRASGARAGQVLLHTAATANSGGWFPASLRGPALHRSPGGASAPEPVVGLVQRQQPGGVHSLLRLPRRNVRVQLRHLWQTATEGRRCVTALQPRTLDVGIWSLPATRPAAPRPSATTLKTNTPAPRRTMNAPISACHQLNPRLPHITGKQQARELRTLKAPASPCQQPNQLNPENFVSIHRTSSAP